MAASTLPRADAGAQAGVPYLADLSLPQLTEWMASLGEPSYRARQVYRQFYHGLANDFPQMTDLPMALRDRLSQAALLNPLRVLAEQVSSDGLTRKALFALPDDRTIESVLMLYAADRRGGAPVIERRTVCVSTQVGCAMACGFCATGQSGFTRNLTPGEILSQVLHFAREVRRQDPAGAISNVIYAGMGEPLANYEATVESIRRLNDRAAFALGARHVTISTAGWVPGIRRLAAEPLQVGLAVSLHAPDDSTRGRLMPVNAKFPVAELMAACRHYAEKTGRRVSFEYILIAGVNASVQQARQLAALLKSALGHVNLGHVNLIPLNAVDGVAWRAPAKLQVLTFERVLAEAGIPVSLRVERGGDIRAACGQLRGRVAAGAAS